MMWPHLPCRIVMQYTLIQECRMSFYFSSGQSRLVVITFFLIEGLFMRSGWGFYLFIQVFHHELVDTGQVSLMIKLSDIKTKSLSTRHG